MGSSNMDQATWIKQLVVAGVGYNLFITFGIFYCPEQKFTVPNLI